MSLRLLSLLLAVCCCCCCCCCCSAESVQPLNCSLSLSPHIYAERNSSSQHRDNYMSGNVTFFVTAVTNSSSLEFTLAANVFVGSVSVSGPDGNHVVTGFTRHPFAETTTVTLQPALRKGATYTVAFHNCVSGAIDLGIGHHFRFDRGFFFYRYAVGNRSKLFASFASPRTCLPGFWETTEKIPISLTLLRRSDIVVPVSMAVMSSKNGNAAAASLFGSGAAAGANWKLDVFRTTWPIQPKFFSIVLMQRMHGGCAKVAIRLHCVWAEERWMRDFMLRQIRLAAPRLGEIEHHLHLHLPAFTIHHVVAKNSVPTDFAHASYGLLRYSSEQLRLHFQHPATPMNHALRWTLRTLLGFSLTVANKLQETILDGLADFLAFKELFGELPAADKDSADMMGYVDAAFASDWRPRWGGNEAAHRRVALLLRSLCYSVGKDVTMDAVSDFYLRSLLAAPNWSHLDFYRSLEASAAGLNLTFSVPSLLDPWLREPRNARLTFHRDGQQLVAGVSFDGDANRTAIAPITMVTSANVSSSDSFPAGAPVQWVTHYGQSFDASLPRGSWYLLNARSVGLYRVQLESDADNLEAICRQLETDSSVFSITERLRLLGDVTDSYVRKRLEDATLLRIAAGVISTDHVLLIQKPAFRMQSVLMYSFILKFRLTPAHVAGTLEKIRFVRNATESLYRSLLCDGSNANASHETHTLTHVALHNLGTVVGWSDCQRGWRSEDQMRSTLQEIWEQHRWYRNLRRPPQSTATTTMEEEVVVGTAAPTDASD